MKRTSNPCAATTPNGTKCGRRAKLGEQFCSAHKAIALGQTVGRPFETVIEINEVEILKKLARDPNPQVRLRAVDLH